MADQDEAYDAVIEALHAAAVLAKSQYEKNVAGGYALQYATTVKELAEAAAWLTRPAHA
jgi:hypothetical protein